MSSKTERIPRSRYELVEALRRHVRLLKNYSDQAFPGPTPDQDYLGEVAAKLRLLIVTTDSNKPLLLKLMAEYGIDSAELREHLDFPAYGTMTLSRGAVRRTNAEVIAAWANQHGAAHEDWAISEEYSGVFATDEPGLYPSLAILLHDTALKVFAAAEKVFAKATAELDSHERQE